jgi:hypothetical protein
MRSRPGLFGLGNLVAIRSQIFSGNNEALHLIVRVNASYLRFWSARRSGIVKPYVGVSVLLCDCGREQRTAEGFFSRIHVNGLEEDTSLLSIFVFAPCLTTS